jgi:hypothetical protein
MALEHLGNIPSGLLSEYLFCLIPEPHIDRDVYNVSNVEGEI